MEGDDKVKTVQTVHRNLLLPLFFDPSKQDSDQTSKQDHESLVDPKEIMGTQVSIVAGAIATDVHNLSTCEGAKSHLGNKHVPKG